MSEKAKPGELRKLPAQPGGGLHERTVRRRLSELRREAAAYAEGRARITRGA